MYLYYHPDTQQFFRYDEETDRAYVGSLDIFTALHTYYIKTLPFNPKSCILLTSQKVLEDTDILTVETRFPELFL